MKIEKVAAVESFKAVIDKMNHVSEQHRHDMKTPWIVRRTGHIVSDVSRLKEMDVFDPSRHIITLADGSRTTSAACRS